MKTLDHPTRAVRTVEAMQKTINHRKHIGEKITITLTRGDWIEIYATITQAPWHERLAPLAAKIKHQYQENRK